MEVWKNHLQFPCFCGTTSKKAAAANVTESMSKAMTQIASALTPGDSPAKIIGRNATSNWAN